VSPEHTDAVAAARCSSFCIDTLACARSIKGTMRWAAGDERDILRGTGCSHVTSLYGGSIKLFGRYVQLDFPPCSMDEALRHADRLREAGIDVSVVKAFSPRWVLKDQSSLSLDSPQLYVLKVPREQAESAYHTIRTQ
jgi:hypothetical protein